MRNGLFYVAKEEGNDRVLGIAMWLRPQPLGRPPSWYDWFEDWRMWFNQGIMNVRYGRGGLNVKVGLYGATGFHTNASRELPSYTAADGPAETSSQLT